LETDPPVRRKEVRKVNEQQLREYQGLPQSEACRLIDFDEAEILSLRIFPPQYVLVVSGIKPYLNMDVSLRPRTYIRQLEYWGIEVVGFLPGIGIPTLAPYTDTIRLAGLMGTEGIEVIGATRSEKLTLWDLPPEAFENWARSHEEDTEEVEAYRPRNFDFPPSFPRPGFEIKANGEFQEYVPDPLDRGVVPGLSGHWTAEERRIVHVIFDDPEAEPRTLRIASVEEGLLELER
jgi:hypothetical protein